MSEMSEARGHDERGYPASPGNDTIRTGCLNIGCCKEWQVSRWSQAKDLHAGKILGYRETRLCTSSGEVESGFVADESRDKDTNVSKKGTRY